jgi:uncharacterized protein (DUF1330 family)
MPKAYWIARVDVTNFEKYKAYTVANAEAFALYGARFLIRSGRQESVEGVARMRNVVVEFPSYASAVDCWNSPQYRHAFGLREGAGIADIVIVEGYDGPQPSQCFSGR